MHPAAPQAAPAAEGGKEEEEVPETVDTSSRLMFDMIDADGSGAISAQEFAEFSRFDAVMANLPSLEPTEQQAATPPQSVTLSAAAQSPSATLPS